MASSRLVRFDTANAPEPEASQPATVLEGNPQTITRNFFTDQTGHFFSGIWESTQGKWRVSYSENEFVYMLEGEAVLTADDGPAERVNAGDSFVVPAGFQGTWESVTDVKKLYAIYEAG
jgi:uncharacterized cupin superfamily protein